MLYEVNRLFCKALYFMIVVTGLRGYGKSKRIEATKSIRRTNVQLTRSIMEIEKNNHEKEDHVG